MMYRLRGGVLLQLLLYAAKRERVKVVKVVRRTQRVKALMIFMTIRQSRGKTARWERAATRP